MKNWELRARSVTCRSDNPHMHRSNIDEREDMLRQKEEELKSREVEETTRQMTFGKVSEKLGQRI